MIKEKFVKKDITDAFASLSEISTKLAKENQLKNTDLIQHIVTTQNELQKLLELVDPNNKLPKEDDKKTFFTHDPEILEHIKEANVILIEHMPDILIKKLNKIVKSKKKELGQEYEDGAVIGASLAKYELIEISRDSKSSFSKISGAIANAQKILTKHEKENKTLENHKTNTDKGKTLSIMSSAPENAVKTEIKNNFAPKKKKKLVIRVINDDIHLNSSNSSLETEVAPYSPSYSDVSNLSKTFSPSSTPEMKTKKGRQTNNRVSR